MYDEIIQTLHVWYKLGLDLCREILKRALIMAKEAALEASKAVILVIAQGLAIQHKLGLKVA